MTNRRARTSVDKAVVDVWQREVGELSTRNFAHRLAASEDLVLRLELDKKLEKHRGCVNTVNFNADGDILVSGSDDRRVILWDWETGHAKLSFQSGHVSNVFQAKFMPYTDDRSLVRHAQISERGVETKLLAKHQGRAHKLAIEPGSPHILYTCGEDGLVQHIDLRTGTATELFTCHPINDSRRYPLEVIGLNAIVIDPRNPNLFAIAGSDEYTRLYDIRKYKWDASTDFGQPTDHFCPPHLSDEHVGITGLAFSDQSELLVSYGGEFIYLFTRDMGLGPNPVPSSPLSACSEASEMGLDHSAASASAKEAMEAIPQVYKGHRNCETVKGVSFFGPKSEYVASGSDCGRIFIWKKKGGELVRVMEADKRTVNCIESHPHTMVLASSGIENDIKIWTPKAIDKAILPTNIEQFKPNSRGWMLPVIRPQDLMLRLFSMQRRGGSPERNGENSSAASRELLELIWTFNANSDASSDDGGDLSGKMRFRGGEDWTASFTAFDFVLRLELDKKLEKHRGCVNTLSFNADGDILVSGSDDRQVILWDWETGHAKLSFQSGHVNNVFQAKFMPYTDDRSLVTCALDGQVRHAQISERGVETKLLAKHQGRAYKLAIEPGSPHILYTCGEDRLVQHIDLRTGTATKLFTCHPINDSRRRLLHLIGLNAIAIDPRNPNLFAIAGFDEYTRLYDIRKYKWDASTDFGQPTDHFCPPHLIDEYVGITGLAFSDQSELLVSYGKECIYLFTQDMGLGPNPVPSSLLSACSEASEMGLDHSAATASAKEAIPQVYKGHRNFYTVKGVSFVGPKSVYVASGSDCGQIFIWEKKDGELVRVMEADKHVVNCIESHPHTMVLASSGIESNIKIWSPTAIDKAILPTNIEQFDPKSRSRMFPVSGPQDLMLRLSSLQRQGSSPDRNGENSSAVNSDASSDDGGDASGPEDFFS
ncbi:hypothetical protein CCACVL1_21421 [Corchorus capsularis]|uniref:Anaphase-promoting complex subunit 4 WD40 domain-containing protein n=1 Tax=Corchorus capsularis TaxID=210143 RepID=A0A1R3H5Z1_COCAP|nr:hypothetical protein CCACVL1_21421 [Corchorus capsularis]